MSGRRGSSPSITTVPRRPESCCTTTPPTTGYESVVRSANACQEPSPSAYETSWQRPLSRSRVPYPGDVRRPTTVPARPYEPVCGRVAVNDLLVVQLQRYPARACDD